MFSCFEKFNNIARREIHSSNYSKMQRFERMRRFFYVWSRALFVSVAHDIYCEGGFKITLYTLYVYIVIIFSVISSIYTIIFYDWFTRLNALTITSICMQVSDFMF